MKDLKKCPFCGKDPILEEERTIWIVRCECSACVLGDRISEEVIDKCLDVEEYEPYKYSAINRWNMRV